MTLPRLTVWLKVGIALWLITALIYILAGHWVLGILSALIAACETSYLVRVERRLRRG